MKKLKLDELKVQSFVTELNPGLAQTAKGGDDGGYGDDGTKADNTFCQTMTIIVTATVASKWPCASLCHTQTTASPGGGGGGTGGGTGGGGDPTSTPPSGY